MQSNINETEIENNQDSLLAVRNTQPKESQTCVKASILMVAIMSLIGLIVVGVTLGNKNKVAVEFETDQALVNGHISSNFTLLGMQVASLQATQAQLQVLTQALNTTVNQQAAMISGLQSSAAISRTDVLGNYTAVFGQQMDLSPDFTYLKGLSNEEMSDLYISQISWNGGNSTYPIIDAFQFTLSNGKKSEKFVAGIDKVTDFDNTKNLTSDQQIKWVSVGFADFNGIYRNNTLAKDSVIVELDFFADTPTLGWAQVLDIGGNGSANYYVQTGKDKNTNIIGAAMTAQQYNYDSKQNYGFKTAQFATINDSAFDTPTLKAKKNYLLKEP